MALDAAGAASPRMIAHHIQILRGPANTSRAANSGGGSQGRRGRMVSAESHSTAPCRTGGRTTIATAAPASSAAPSHQNDGSTAIRGAPGSAPATASAPHETQSPTLLHRIALSEEGDSRLAVIRRACYHRSPAACTVHTRTYVERRVSF